TFHFDLVSVEFTVSFYTPDDEVIHRNPNRPAPVGVATEKVAGGITGIIADGIVHSIDVNRIRIFLMVLRQGTDTRRRKELFFVEQPFQQTYQPFLWNQRQQNFAS